MLLGEGGWGLFLLVSSIFFYFSLLIFFKYCLSLMSFVYFPYGEHINAALFIKVKLF